MGFNSLQLPELPSLSAVLIFPIVEESSLNDLWPLPGTPEPDLCQKGLTEARCVYEFFHGRTTDQKLDALQHLANICMKKSGKTHWNPRPYLKFVGARTARKDWENSDPYWPVLRRNNTRGWFLTNLPEQIVRYSPQHVTRRELLELARLRDPDLLHVCHALVCDLKNESEKQTLHELPTTRLWEHQGTDFYFDREKQSAVPLEAVNHFTPDYSEAVRLLVEDTRFRSALSKPVRTTLELVFRKLAAGTDVNDVIPTVADALNRDARTVRRNLMTAREIATDLSSSSSKLLQTLESLVLPDELLR